jgi:HK97 family phage major capsid protein
MPPGRPIALTERPDAVRSLVRSVIATGSRVFDDRLPPADFLKRRSWGDDRVANLITRGAASPAMTSQAGWAQELGQVSQAFLRTLTPMSAAAQLLDACLSLSFDGAARISLPNVVPGTATWVAEGAPIRVPTVPALVGSSLEPTKLATIIELSREMMDSSNIEAIVRQALIDATAAALDAYLFDATAATAGLRPAGILFGLSAIAPSTSTSKVEAMDDDIANLVAAIAPRAGNGSIAFVMSPPQATPRRRPVLS